MGSNNKQLTILDVMNIMSFLIGIQNLELNIDQNDMDSQTQEISKAANELVGNALADIHAHLQRQDRKIDAILERLNENH